MATDWGAIINAGGRERRQAVSLSTQSLAEKLLARARTKAYKVRYAELREVPNSTLFGRRGRFRFARGADLQFGNGIVVQENFYIFAQGRIRIGDSCFINRDFYLSSFTEVCIGRGVRIGERCSIHDENHVFEPIPILPDTSERYLSGPVKIGDGAWIGSNCVLTAGSEVGHGSVVGANSVVVGVIPPGVLAGGAPARVLRKLVAHDGP